MNTGILQWEKSCCIVSCLLDLIFDPNKFYIMTPKNIYSIDLNIVQASK